MLYRHYKGKYYLKLLTVRDSDDCTKRFVIYMSLYKNDFKFGQVWVRSEDRFNDAHPSAKVKRFRRLGSYEIVLLIVGLNKYIKT